MKKLAIVAALALAAASTGCGATHDAGDAGPEVTDGELPLYCGNVGRPHVRCDGGPGPFCGNRVVDPGEECDDGIATDACSHFCELPQD